MKDKNLKMFACTTIVAMSFAALVCAALAVKSLIELFAK